MLSVINFVVFAFSGGGESQGSLLEVNPGLIFWTVVTFVILLVILRMVAWKPILGALSDRENFIKESLEKAEAARVEAEKLSIENKAALSKTEKEAQQIIMQGREMAEKLKTQILEESKRDAKKMVDDAASEIDRKTKEAFNTLKTQIAEIAVQAAEKIIKENLDKKKQSQIIDNFINDFNKN